MAALLGVGVGLLAAPQPGTKTRKLLLKRLAALSADHFETHPDEINWGHVGTLNHYRAKLREITDMAFSEGEHAE